MGIHALASGRAWKLLQEYLEIGDLGDILLDSRARSHDESGYQ